MKKNHFIIGLVILLICLSFTLGYEISYSDSGWDTSYDSGGFDYDYDGGSYDYDYGNDYDFDYGSNSGYSRSSGSSNLSEGESLVISLITAFVLFYVFYVGFCQDIKNKKTIIPSRSEYPQYYIDDIHGLNKFLPNVKLAQLKKQLYTKFLDIQKAWMEFDYEKLRELCTDELYNSYKTQLKVLQAKNGKNIMSGFQSHTITITSVKEQNNQIIVEAYMRITFYDYVIDTKTNEVTRGDKNLKVNNNYLMTFIKSKDGTNVNECPNCGAPLNTKNSSTCEYCNSHIIIDSNDFVLSRKTNMRQF